MLARDVEALKNRAAGFLVGLGFTIGACALFFWIGRATVNCPPL